MDENSVISAFIVDFKRSHKPRNGFAGMITVFLRWLDKRKVMLERLSSVDVSEYLAERERTGLTSGSVRAYLHVLRLFFRFAARKKLMPPVDTTDISVPWIQEPGGYPSYRGAFRAIYESPKSALRLYQLPWVKDLEEDVKRMLAQGYTRPRIAHFLQTAGSFQRWLQRRGITQLDCVKASDVKAFMSGGQGTSTTRPTMRALVEMFLRNAFERRGKRFVAKKPKVTWLEPELVDFKVFRREHGGVRPLTNRHSRERLEYFAQFLARHGIRNVRGITVELIDAFIAKMRRRGWNRTSLKGLTACLRPFFRYLEMMGTLQEPLAEKVGEISSFRADRRPKYLPWLKVQAFLKAFPRESPTDKRDYAITLLVVSYGLRAREVTKMTLQDLDFEKSRLNIPERKNGREAVFPMRPEFEAALKAYLAVRPDVPFPQLFLRSAAPIRPLMSVVGVIRRHLLAYFGPPSSGPRGAYVLRHSFAKAMLDRGALLTDLRTVLGHSRLESTLVYTRIHARHLSEVADNYAKLL